MNNLLMEVENESFKYDHETNSLVKAGLSLKKKK